MLRQSSVVLDLRLIGFETAQGSSGCRRLGNAVAATNSFELAFTNDFHSDSNLSVVGSLSRAERDSLQALRLEIF